MWAVDLMASFGEELKRERELRQVSLREVSEATKINLRYLEALETNNFEHLPGGVFNRGFVRAYSQFIGIDPDAMVNAYRLEEQAQASSGKAKDRDSFHRPWKRTDAETSATVELSPFMGGPAFDAAIAHLNGEELDKWIPVAGSLYTNRADYDADHE